MYYQTRKIKPTRRSVSGKFSFRCIDSIPYESTLERDFLIRTEYNQRVTKIIAQPTQIPFVGLNGRTYTYTPDFLVYFKSENTGCPQKTLLVEVKPQEDLLENWSKLKPKFSAAMRYAKERDWNFRIFNENRIRDQYLENIKFLHGFKRTDLPHEKAQSICATLNQLGSRSVSDLINQQCNDPIEQWHVWNLVANNFISCDLYQPLSLNTKVTILTKGIVQ